jgi:hypothetical protein
MPTKNPGRPDMDYLIRSEGTGFVAGSLIAFLVLAAVFALTMAL